MPARLVRFEAFNPATMKDMKAFMKGHEGNCNDRCTCNCNSERIDTAPGIHGSRAQPDRRRSRRKA
jgi:hypothetical protein